MRELEECISRHFTRIERKLETLSATIAEATANIQAALSKLGTDLQVELSALKEAIAAGQDTAKNIENLDAIATQIGALDASVVAATPSAPAQAASASTSTGTESAPAEASPASA